MQKAGEARLSTEGPKTTGKGPPRGVAPLCGRPQACDCVQTRAPVLYWAVFVWWWLLKLSDFALHLNSVMIASLPRTLLCEENRCKDFVHTRLPTAFRDEVNQSWTSHGLDSILFWEATLKHFLKDSCWDFPGGTKAPGSQCRRPGFGAWSGDWKWKWSCSVVSDASWPHGLQPTRLLRPWDLPGKSTGVGRHCLLHIHTTIYKTAD